MDARERKLIYGLVFLSTVSLFVSLSCVYSVLSQTNAWHKHTVNEHRLGKRAVGDLTDCSDDALASYDTTTHEGATSRHIHELTCKNSAVREQMDSWVDEFNSMLFFINEIGMNMQVAKNNINANEQRAFLATLAADRAVNLSQQNTGAITNAARVLNVTNSALTSQGTRLGVVESKCESFVQILRKFNTTLRRSLKRQQEPPRLASSDHVDQIRQLITLGNESAVFKTIVSRGEENSKHIETVLASITRLKTKLTNLMSGWYNAPNGYQYFLSRNAFTSNAFVRSRRYCKHRGADLAHIGIRNPDIFRYLWHTFIAPARHHCVWVGMTDLAEEGEWLWVDGEAVDDHWTNWGPKLPGRAFLQDCGLVRGGKWGEGPCSGHRKLCSFICERKILDL